MGEGGYFTLQSLDLLKHTSVDEQLNFGDGLNFTNLLPIGIQGRVFIFQKPIITYYY